MPKISPTATLRLGPKSALMHVHSLMKLTMNEGCRGRERRGSRWLAYRGSDRRDIGKMLSWRS